ncbi:MAG: glucosamine-6-phosphate deaminase, partial [Eubacteriales bacterium]|nr:glucosamine-6-phosphate deaminase [Eubacteriales bacterium]
MGINFFYYEKYREACKKAADLIKSQITLKPSSVLGLATGSTSVGIYEKLIQYYKDNEVNFSKCKSFNLDEYVGLEENNFQSFHYYMYENLFNHINMSKENINIPDGNARDVENYCKMYDEKIEELGGIDIQLLGIGQNGHIGFNEPGDCFKLYTHKEELKESTIQNNARFFKSIGDVPKSAITMGLFTIFKAKKIIIMAAGEEKKEIFD